MLNLPVLRWGKPYDSLGKGPGRPFHHRRADRRGQSGERRAAAARYAQCEKRPQGAARFQAGGVDRADQESGRFVSERHAADGGRHAVARSICPAAIGDHRAAGAHGQGEHGQEPFRAHAHGSNARRPDARAAAGDSVARLRRGSARRGGELSMPSAGAGRRAAVEFAGRSHAVAAGDSDAGRPGAQARAAGTVDAVSHDGGVRAGGHSGRSDRHLSRRRRCRRGGAGELASAA